MKALLGLFEVSQVHQGGRGIGEDAVCPTVDQERKAELRQCKIHEKGGIMQDLFFAVEIRQIRHNADFQAYNSKTKKLLSIVLARRRSPPQSPARTSFIQRPFQSSLAHKKKRPVKKEA